MSGKNPRKPGLYELMFMAAVCDQSADGRCVQIGDDPRETLTAPHCRRLAAWLLKAAEWIDAKEGGR